MDTRPTPHTFLKWWHNEYKSFCQNVNDLLDNKKRGLLFKKEMDANFLKRASLSNGLDFSFKI